MTDTEHSASSGSNEVIVVNQVQSFSLLAGVYAGYTWGFALRYNIDLIRCYGYVVHSGDVVHSNLELSS